MINYFSNGKWKFEKLNQGLKKYLIKVIVRVLGVSGTSYVCRLGQLILSIGVIGFVFVLAVTNCIGGRRQKISWSSTKAENLALINVTAADVFGDRTGAMN